MQTYLISSFQENQGKTTHSLLSLRTSSCERWKN